MAQDGKIVFGFDGGAIGGAVPDVVQPPGFTDVGNVRHTIERGAPVKCPRLYQDRYTATSPSGLCTGVIPHPRSDSCLFAFDAPTRVTDVSSIPLARHDGADGSVSTVRTLAVEDAGITMPGRSVVVPSVAVSPTGSVWTAQIQQKSLSTTYPATGELAAYVSLREGDTTIFERRLACVVESGSGGVVNSGAWCSVTTNTDGSAVLWYCAGALLSSAQPIRARRLSVGAGGALVVGSEVTIMSPGVAAADKCRAPAVFADDTAAWVACPTATTNLRVVRVDPSSLAVTATANLAPASGGDFAKATVSLAYATGTGGGLVVAAQAPNAACWWLLGASSLSTIDSRTAPTGLAVGACVALSYEAPTGEVYAGAAYSPVDVTPALSATTPTLSRPSVTISMARVGGVESYGAVIDFMRLAAGYQAGGVAGQAPVIALLPWYGTLSAPDDPTDPAYVLDPAITLAAVKPIVGTTTVDVAPCGRLGVDRVTPYVWSYGYALGWATAWGACMQTRGGRFALAYLEGRRTDTLIADGGLTGRYVVLSRGSHQPAVAQVGDAMAVTGGSIPLYYDGTELSELCPLHQPKLFLSTTTAGTTAAAEDGYFVAVVSWVDGSGREHRSTPSLPLRVTLTSGAARPKILVTAPFSTHNGSMYARAKCRLYWASAASGSSVFRLSSAEPDLLVINGCWAFSASAASSPEDARALYTEGGELPSEHPPAAQDVVVALDRVWMIDAESRSDVWYTKPAAPGFAPEFNGAQKITFPASAGPLVALAEIGGQLIALGERGVATVYGDGPDASGRGEFGSPRLVAKIGCTNRRSVARFQGGVIYESAGRYVRMGPDGAQVMPDSPVVTSNLILGSAVMENGSEVYFAGSGHVYNYQSGTWQNWPFSAPPAGVSTAQNFAIENSDGQRAWVARLGGDGVMRVGRIDGGEASETDQASWRTGHIVPPGDQQQDVEWSQVVIHAIRESSHGLSIRVDSDYGAQNTTHVWTAAEIDAIRDPTSRRYTVGVDIVHRKARSIRLLIQETGAYGTGFRPVSCTVYFSLANGQARRPLKPGARK